MLNAAAESYFVMIASSAVFCPQSLVTEAVQVYNRCPHLCGAVCWDMWVWAADCWNLCAIAERWLRGDRCRCLCHARVLCLREDVRQRGEEEAANGSDTTPRTAHHATVALTISLERGVYECTV